MLTVQSVEHGKTNKLNYINMKITKQRKYLVWIGGSYNSFNTLDEATKEKQNYLNKGYTDIQIETITCSKFIKELNNYPTLF